MRRGTYGTTSEGGTGVCKYEKYGCGTAFKLDRTGKQVWLHRFQYGGGESPMAGLLRDADGNLYGTTVYGGENGSSCGAVKIGCGVVFKLDKNGKETVLHRFSGGTSDGEFPEALLIQDSAGNLYGTTIQGEQYDEGTAFKLDKKGKETILFTFALRLAQSHFPASSRTLRETCMARLRMADHAVTERSSSSTRLARRRRCTTSAEAIAPTRCRP